ncbi:MAG: DUF5723 family protein [Cytophagales bacterium]|nr:DUF5723 family protein [Cytophagales bacterium]
MKKSISIILIFSIISTVYGQGEFSLYNLNRSVPQAHQLNPAFRPDAKIVIGLPVLSSAHVSVDLDQLSFSRIFTESFEQPLTLDAENFSDLLREKNNFSVQSDLQLFFLGLNLGDNFFSLAINDRVNNWLVYSKDIADLVLFGNGDERTFGRDLSLDHTLLRQNLYHEFALGYAVKISDKLSLGARFKILSGVLNAQTEQVNGYLRTDLDSIHISNSNFTFRNSGYNYFTEDLDIFSVYRNTLPFSGGNSGIGFDFGAEYQINDRLSISGSITDLGYIKWKENTESYSFNDVSYSFKGFDVIDLINAEDDNNDFIQNELDSLENLFTPNELENIVYRSSLVSNFYTGLDYKLGDKHHAGLQVYGKVAEGNINSEIGAYYNFRLGRIVNSVVNASFRNGKIHAAGVGVSLDLGPIQVYGTTESVTSLINPRAASLVDARVGMNLKFGRKKKMKDELVAREKTPEISEDSVVERAILPNKIEATKVKSPESNTSAHPAAILTPVAVSTAVPPPPEITEEIAENKVVIPEEGKDETPGLPQVAEEQKAIVVHRGDHEDELELGHYVVVGAFLSKANAQTYSMNLKAKGYNNDFGFLTEKDFYYVTVYKNSGDIEKAREVRNEYRKKEDFLFPDTWLLSVVE